MKEKPERITPRSIDYSKWYHDIIRQADLAEAAEVVKGCMVIKPHGYAIWEKMQAELDSRFKALGVANAYFPLLIPKSFLEKEAKHVEGFAPELAVVTHAGGKLLEEPYVIRPTSETIIGYFFARWINSYRDLPLRINQWANVVRWEMRTRMFLRTTEFLWQEGHTAHATHDESIIDAKKMLQCYLNFVEDILCVPVIYGQKSESERFAGALTTWSIEALMQDGKALQMGTSHDLGQNFAQAFGVTFQDEQGNRGTPWQSSWGVSTRLMGGLIMTHADDAGLVLPPFLAPVQVVIIPILGKGHDPAILALAARLHDQLSVSGIKSYVDDRDYTPGFKFFSWEQKGVCWRIEIGSRDIDNNTVTLKSRLHRDKESIPVDEIAATMPERLQLFRKALWQQALVRLQTQTKIVDDYPTFVACLSETETTFVLAHWDGTTATEQLIKAATKATIRVIPDAASLTAYFGADAAAYLQPGSCIKTGKPSRQRVLFARAY